MTTLMITVTLVPAAMITATNTSTKAVHVDTTIVTNTSTKVVPVATTTIMNIIMNTVHPAPVDMTILTAIPSLL